MLSGEVDNLGDRVGDRGLKWGQYEVGLRDYLFKKMLDRFSALCLML